MLVRLALFSAVGTCNRSTDGRAAQVLIEACLGYQQVDAKRQIGSGKLRLQILYHGAKHLWRIAHASCRGRCGAAGLGCCIRTARSSVTEAAACVGGRKKKRRTYHADAPCIRHSCCKVRARRLQRRAHWTAATRSSSIAKITWFMPASITGFVMPSILVTGVMIVCIEASVDLKGSPGDHRGCTKVFFF